MTRAPQSYEHYSAPHAVHKDGKFKNATDQQLYYGTFFPSTSTKQDAHLRGVVFFLHGIAEHSRRYCHWFTRLCAQGYGVLSYDLVGHGASDDDVAKVRAHAQKFQYFVDDTNEFLTFANRELLPKYIKRDAPPPKMIYMGQSYGTLVGLHTVLSEAHTFDAVVLCAPALMGELTGVLRVQKAFAGVLSSFVPRARIVPGVNFDGKGSI